VWAAFFFGGECCFTADFVDAQHILLPGCESTFFCPKWIEV
jgi:hypothetical protein